MAPARRRPPTSRPRRTRRSSRDPTPPLATTGTLVAARTAQSCSTSGPVIVPSRPISVTTNAATPEPAKRRTSSTRSVPVPSVQPRMATCRPRASSPTATCPGWRSHNRSTSPGDSTAAVPTTTRAAPARRSRSAASSSRTPPPAWTGTSTARHSAVMVERFSADPVRAASRSTTCNHRAPAASNRRATAAGSSS